jgi:hypothetical protein
MPATQPKRSDRETVVTLRLPRELHERLKNEAGERGLTAEVRRRLEASFTETPPAVAADLKVREATAAIAWLLNLPRSEADDDVSTWFYETVDAFWDTRTGIATVLDRYRPDDAGEPRETSTGRLLASLALHHVRGGQ